MTAEKGVSPSAAGEVGYAKPPVATRFKKGQSGNPKGRSKGTQNLKTDLLEELTERIPVHEGTTKKSISKQRALIKAIFAKAARGDMRAADIIIKLVVAHQEAPTTKYAEAPPTQDDALLIELVGQYLQEQGKLPPVPAANSAPPPESEIAKEK